MDTQKSYSMYHFKQSHTVDRKSVVGFIPDSQFAVFHECARALVSSGYFANSNTQTHEKETVTLKAGNIGNFDFVQLRYGKQPDEVEDVIVSQAEWNHQALRASHGLDTADARLAFAGKTDADERSVFERAVRCRILP